FQRRRKVVADRAPRGGGGQPAHRDAADRHAVRQQCLGRRRGRRRRSRGRGGRAGRGRGGGRRRGGGRPVGECEGCEETRDGAGAGKQETKADAFHASSEESRRKIRGSSLMIASTPASVRATATSLSFTVQAQQAAPRAWHARTAAGVISGEWSGAARTTERWI